MNKMKRQTIGENICKPCIKMWLISNIYNSVTRKKQFKNGHN